MEIKMTLINSGNTNIVKEFTNYDDAINYLVSVNPGQKEEPAEETIEVPMEPIETLEVPTAIEVEGEAVPEVKPENVEV